MLYAMQHGNGGPARLSDLYLTRDPDAADVAEIIDILDRTGAREYTRGEARRHRDTAWPSSMPCSISTPPLARSWSGSSPR